MFLSQKINILNIPEIIIIIITKYQDQQKTIFILIFPDY